MVEPRSIGTARRRSSKGPVAAAAATGCARDLLVAMLARVAAAVDDPDTPARDLASLSKRGMDLSKELAAIDVKARQEGSRTRAGDETWQAI